MLAKNALRVARMTAASIAYQEIQGRRAMKPVPLPPGGVLHDYVPFYFAPRSPMLFTINNGNVTGCPYRQDDILHLATKVENIVELSLPFVFYNFNASLAFAECFNRLDDLALIDWPLFFEEPRIGGYCRYWKSMHDPPHYARRMETRQAELLVHERVPLGVVAGVGTSNQRTCATVEGIVRAAGSNLAVRAKPEWYF